jgi:hypothetical protein
VGKLQSQWSFLHIQRTAGAGGVTADCAWNQMPEWEWEGAGWQLSKGLPCPIHNLNHTPCCVCDIYCRLQHERCARSCPRPCMQKRPAESNAGAGPLPWGGGMTEATCRFTGIGPHLHAVCGIYCRLRHQQWAWSCPRSCARRSSTQSCAPLLTQQQV